MEFIKAKTILTKVNYGKDWYGVDYNMNLYRGCPHKCIYCDSRSNCYHIENFDVVRGKENALQILEQELLKKKNKGIIGIGSMSDTYNPFEKKYEQTRGALKLLSKYNFGVSIDTKSDLILRDIDLLKEINSKNNAIIKFTITTPNDELSRIIEPNVCVSSKRFECVKTLTDNGIYTGIMMNPILPFITDNEEDLKKMVKLAHEYGAKFIFTYMGMTLRENQRDYYYEQLDLEENPMFANTKVVIVTLDNAYITNKFYRTEYIGETVDAGNKIIIFDFSKDGSYELGFFDSVSSSDAAFIYKYILEPIFIEANAQLDEENTAYFNIVDEKVVVGDKDNSIFKLIVKESSIELLPTNTDLEKVTVTAKYEEIKAKQYKEDAQSEDEFRYLKYNLTFNVVYGNEPVNYMTLEGDNQIVDLSKNQGVTFRFNMDYQKFLNDGKVYVNGNLVDKAKYTSSEGSTIITLKDDYLKTLSLGKYTLKVAVADGDVSATFTVKNDTENKTNNPQTGDNIVIYIVLFIVSLVGITLIVIKNKKIKRGE